MKAKKINELSRINPAYIGNKDKFWAVYASMFYENLFQKIDDYSSLKYVYMNLLRSNKLNPEAKRALTFFYRIRRDELNDPEFWEKRKPAIHENKSNKMKAKLVKESINELNNAFGPMAASSNYERGGDPEHNNLVRRAGEIEDYIFQNGNRVDAQEWDNLVENFLYGQPGEYDPEEIEEERYFNDLTNEELEELIGRGEFLINNIKKYVKESYQNIMPSDRSDASYYPDELTRIKDEAKTISREEGVVQHVNEVRPGVYKIDDWYDEDTTVASYENGIEL